MLGTQAPGQLCTCVYVHASWPQELQRQGVTPPFFSWLLVSSRSMLLLPELAKPCSEPLGSENWKWI